MEIRRSFSKPASLQNPILARKAALAADSFQQRRGEFGVAGNIVENASFLRRQRDTGNHCIGEALFNASRCFSIGKRKRKQILLRLTLRVIDSQKQDGGFTLREGNGDGFADLKHLDTPPLGAEPAPLIQITGQDVFQFCSPRRIEKTFPIRRSERRQRMRYPAFSVQFRGPGRLEAKPENSVRRVCEKIWLFLDHRKIGSAEQLDGHTAMELGEVEPNWLRVARQVGNHENPFVAEFADEGENLPVFGMQELNGPLAKSVPALAQV